MAVELSSMRNRIPGGIMTHLSLAACEWFLMFLLFLDAAFTYFLREFAKYCELQTPCYLCSSLDRVLGEKKMGCSLSLLCSSHTKEISSLAFCTLQDELSDFRGMCEECLELISMQNRRLSGSGTCLCCKKALLVVNSDDESLLGLKANIEPCRRFSRRDGMKRLRDKLAASMKHRITGKNSTFSCVGYTEFRFSSDSEQEDDRGDGNTGVEFGREAHLEMQFSDAISENSETKDQACLLDLNELKSVDPPLSEVVIGRASRDVTSLDRAGSFDASAESSSVSSDPICIAPSASSTVRITKKSIYIEEPSEVVNISGSINIEEETDGTSSDDTTCSSHSYSRNLTSTDWNEEDAESMPRASNSEVKEAGPGSEYEHEKSTKDEDYSSQSKRNDTTDESLDGFCVSDVTGETIIDQLRRQVEHDRRIMKSLNDELEAERNAAEIAVDQAMAMITRLQEEKAEVETVAVQYMLLMELQAEHDMDLLKRDLISEKEKELQDLQTELEFYRNASIFDNDAATGTSGDSVSASFSKANGRCDAMRGSASEFGDKTLNVSHSLKKLVKNLYKDYCSENVEEFEEKKGNPARCYEWKSGEDGLPLVPRHSSSATKTAVVELGEDDFSTSISSNLSIAI